MTLKVIDNQYIYGRIS